MQQRACRDGCFAGLLFNCSRVGGRVSWAVSSSQADDLHLLSSHNCLPPPGHNDFKQTRKGDGASFSKLTREETHYWYAPIGRRFLLLGKGQKEPRELLKMANVRIPKNLVPVRHGDVQQAGARENGGQALGYAIYVIWGMAHLNYVVAFAPSVSLGCSSELPGTYNCKASGYVNNNLKEVSSNSIGDSDPGNPALSPRYLVVEDD